MKITECKGTKEREKEIQINWMGARAGKLLDEKKIICKCNLKKKEKNIGILEDNSTREMLESKKGDVCKK